MSRTLLVYYSPTGTTTQVRRLERAPAAPEASPTQARTPAVVSP